MTGDRSSFSDRFEKFVGVEKPPTLIVSAIETAEFVATRVQWKRTEEGHPTLFDRANGYLICLQRLDVAAQPYWVDQRPMKLEAMRQGQYLLLDLNVQHSSLVPSDVDCISVYVSGETLKQFQAEHDFLPTGLLRTSLGATHDDDVVRHLGEALLPAIHEPHVASQFYSDHVALALLSRLTAQHGTDSVPIPQPRGGLAPWQQRRAKEMMMACLDGRIGLEDLAAECRLSRSHFARAFKISTGMSPLRWLTAQRIERVKLLLLNTSYPLEQIASSCGFLDASHLTRAFMHATGQPPGAWRRARQF